MNQKEKVVAIDGPSGSGKSTVAQLVAKKLGLLYVDTGALYRALGYVADRQKIPFREGQELDQYLAGLQLEYGKRPGTLVAINGEDLTHKIREHRVSELASKISKIPRVRDFLLDFQRELPKSKVCVMEGRDIGTVIFPNAFLKIFLTASVDERTRRRFHQLQEKGDSQVSFEQVKEDLIERDTRDSQREVAPLKKAPDAVFLDSTQFSTEQVIEQICELAKERARMLGFSLEK